MKKRFWPFSSPIIEFNKPQVTVYKGLESLSTVILQVISLFLWDLRGRLKQTFQKTSVLSGKNVFGPFLLVLSSVTNLQEHFKGVQEVFWHLLWRIWDHLFGTLLVFENTKFLKKKKASFPVNQRFWPVFSRIFECEKSQKHFARIHKGFWQILRK